MRSQCIWRMVTSFLLVVLKISSRPRRRKHIAFKHWQKVLGDSRYTDGPLNVAPFGSGHREAPQQLSLIPTLFENVVLASFD